MFNLSSAVCSLLHSFSIHDNCNVPLCVLIYKTIKKRRYLELKIKHQEQLLNCLESDQSASSVPGTPSDGPDTPASGPSPSDFQQIPGPSSSPIEIEEINWETRGTDSTNQMAYFRPIKGQNQFFKDRSQVNISPVASPFMLRTPQTPDTTKETQKSYQKSYTAQLRIVCQNFSL